MTDPDTLSGITTSGSVSTGTKIGEMNTTGTDSTGVHLHYMMRQNTTPYNINSGWWTGTAFDPVTYFNANLSTKSNVAPFSNPNSDRVRSNIIGNNNGIYFEFNPNATEKSVLKSIYIDNNN